MGGQPVAPWFDLQAHSDRSDGALVPAEVVARAAEAGVELLALSDHDTVDGVQEAMAEGRQRGIAVVPAAELSALDAGQEDLHILGYGIDPNAPALLEALGRFQEDRESRAKRMISALEELGLAVDHDLLRRHSEGGRSVGRPHLAQAVLEHPHNRTRLIAEQLSDPSAILERYLVPGAPGYRGRTTPTVNEAIALIHSAGGVAVWAHPFWDVEEPAEVTATVERFVAAGLDGVEAFYISHTEAQTVLLADLCERLGLLATGSSDFHGPQHRMFSRFRAFSLFGREPHLGPIDIR